MLLFCRISEESVSRLSEEFWTYFPLSSDPKFQERVESALLVDPGESTALLASLFRSDSENLPQDIVVTGGAPLEVAGVQPNPLLIVPPRFVRLAAEFLEECDFGALLDSRREIIRSEYDGTLEAQDWEWILRNSERLRNLYKEADKNGEAVVKYFNV